ncbi:hypothetical protein Esti_002863 [Eimeria stiedai]
MVRLAVTFVCFWVSLPPAAAAAAAAAEAGAAAGGLWRRGASPEEIRALPLLKYKDKLKQYQQQQQQQQQQGGRQQGRVRRRQQQQRQQDEVGPELEGLSEEESQKRRSCSRVWASTFGGCVICLCEFLEEDLLRELRCGHTFHASCIDLPKKEGKKPAPELLRAQQQGSCFCRAAATRAAAAAAAPATAATAASAAAAASASATVAIASAAASAAATGSAFGQLQQLLR